MKKSRSKQAENKSEPAPTLSRPSPSAKKSTAAKPETATAATPDRKPAPKKVSPPAKSAKPDKTLQPVERPSAEQSKSSPAATTSTPSVPVPLSAPAKITLHKTPASEAASAKTAFLSNVPVPPILLEGDEPVPPPRAGPGEKFALSARPTAQPSAAPPQQLPANYGTGRLTGVARDPYCIFAHWDFTDEQQRYYNTLAADHHLVLRARFGEASGPTAAEFHLHSETRHWFLPVPRPGSRYLIELGYYLRDGSWVSVRISAPVTTPPDQVSEDRTAHFAIASREICGAAAPGQPFAQSDFPIPERAIPPEVHATIKTPVLPESRPPVPQHPLRWTLSQERALAELIGATIKKHQGPGSLEIIELLQRHLDRDLIPLDEQFPLPGPSSLALGISSPFPAEEQPAFSPFGGERLPPRKGFWFNVNAELIIYGATEPNASVTIGGRPIKLRPDGSFSYRFALPDGSYELPVAAAPADQSELRRAELRFGRHTAFDGDVGAHPQDPALRTPHVDHVA